MKTIEPGNADAPANKSDKKMSKMSKVSGADESATGLNTSVKFIKPSKNVEPKSRRVLCWKVTDEPKAFKNMSKAEKQERIQYLWGRIKMAMKIRGGLQRVVNEDNEKGRLNFGLDSDVEYELSESQELEEQLQYEPEGSYNTLAWYLINPESNLSKFQNIQVQLVTWCTLILTPLLLVFGEDYP